MTSRTEQGEQVRESYLHSTGEIVQGQNSVHGVQSVVYTVRASPAIVNEPRHTLTRAVTRGSSGELSHVLNAHFPPS